MFIVDAIEISVPVCVPVPVPVPSVDLKYRLQKCVMSQLDERLRPVFTD